jgi:hypothetical protein
MVDRGPLTWAPVSLSTDRVVFDKSCLGTETEHHDVWTVIHTDIVTRIELEGNLSLIIIWRLMILVPCRDKLPLNARTLESALVTLRPDKIITF